MAPRVPVYEPRQTVGRLPTPNAPPAPSADALGAPVAEGLAKLGQAVSETTYKIADQEIQKANRLRIFNADNALSEVINQEAYNENTGFLHKKGLDALDYSPRLKTLNDAASKIEADLANDTQKTEFRMRAKARIDSTTHEFMSHTASQIDGLNKSTADVAQQNALIAIKANYDNPAKVKEQTDLAVDPILSYAEHEGMKPDSRELLLRQWRSQVHETVLRQYLSLQRVDEAKAYLDAHHGELGLSAGDIERQVGALALAQDADKQATAIISFAKDESVRDYPWLDANAAHGFVDGLPAGHLKDEVRQRVEHEIQVAKQLKEDYGKQLFSDAITAYYTKGRNLYSLEAQSIRAKMFDPKNGFSELWRRLETEDYRERTVTQHERDQANAAALANFMAKPPVEKTQTDIDQQYVGVADKMTRDRMRAEQNKAVQSVRKGLSVAEGNFHTLIKGTIDTVEGLRGPKAKRAATDFAAYMNQWRAEYAAKHNGDEPTLFDIEKQRAHALLRVTNGNFFGGEAFEFQAETKGEAQKYKPLPPEKQPYPLNRTPEAVAPPPPSGERPTLIQRVKQLQAAGKTIPEITKIVNAEGYTLGQ